jgi:hypothetical protein
MYYASGHRPTKTTVTRKNGRTLKRRTTTKIHTQSNNEHAHVKSIATIRDRQSSSCIKTAAYQDQDIMHHPNVLISNMHCSFQLKVQCNSSILKSHNNNKFRLFLEIFILFIHHAYSSFSLSSPCYWLCDLQVEIEHS